MRVSRSTYQSLLELHGATSAVLSLAAGRTVAELHSNEALWSAIRERARSAKEMARRIQSDEATLLAERTGEIALLVDETAVGELLGAIATINSHVTTLLETIPPPRWSSLGVRRRRRRQLMRGQ